MVCQRCILAVKNEAEKLEITYRDIQLGQLEITQKDISAEKLEKLKESLHQLGFEVIDDKKTRLIEKVKSIVIENIHHSGEERRDNWSEMIANKLNYEYNYISNLFSSIEGITIEQYIIRQRIEKVKELLLYDELSLSEIAFRLGYSSASYLTNQFKKVTGMPPGQFRKLLAKKRKPLDNL